MLWWFQIGSSRIYFFINMKHKNVFSKRKPVVLFFTIAFLAMGGILSLLKRRMPRLQGH